MRYKVIELALKKMFGRQLKPADLQAVLNKEAGDEWDLDRIVDPDTAGFLLGKRDAFLLVFRKRDLDDPG